MSSKGFRLFIVTHPSRGEASKVTMFSHLDFSGSVPPAGLARCDVEPGPTSLATAPSLRGLLGLASGPPGSLAPLVLTPRELRHRRPRLHVHQLRREHHGGRDAVVLEPVVVAVHRFVAVDILGVFVNLKVAAVVLRRNKRGSWRAGQRREERVWSSNERTRNEGKRFRVERALGYGNGWRSFVSGCSRASAVLTSQVIPMRVIATAERL